MKEIKFRLRSGNIIVSYERWNSLAGKWCYDTNPNGVFDIRNPFILHTDKDQYTGLKDKNDKEIYEGDIVHYTYDYKGCDNWEVVWDYDAWTMKREEREVGDLNCSDDPNFNTWEDAEVVGNIYENPELLADK